MTKYEFTLRKGLKWSDGVPVTTEDIRFVWEDFILNEALTPIVGTGFRASFKADGEIMDLQIVDDFTFTVTFASPTGRFLKSMGMANLWNP
jgi:peptide/nickel transport system substrate-binding protein